MAEENIVIGIEVGGTGKGISNLKELKQAIKEAQNQVIQGNPEAAKRLAELQDKFEDVKDAAKAVKGDGLEPLKSSFGLLTEGFANFDFDKIKTALGGIGSAFKAIPVFLIAEGISYLVENFDKLKDSGGLLGKALTFIGDAISAAANAANWLADKLGIIDLEAQNASATLTKGANDAKNAIAEQNKEYDNQIKVAKAAGKETIDIELNKQRAIIETNKKLVEQTIEYVRQGNILDEQQRKNLTGQLNAIKDANVEIQAITAEHNKEIETKNKEAYEKWKVEHDKKVWAEKLRFEAKQASDNEDYENEVKVEEKSAKTAEEIEAEKNAELLNLSTWRAEQERIQREKEDADKAASAEKEKQHKREVADTSISLTSKSVAVTKAITDMYFAQQLAGAKGNAEKEREIKKKQFNINKAFGIVNATIDGVQAVQKALDNPYPLNIVLAVLSGVMAAANVAQIASTKFDDSGGSSGGGGGSIGSSVGSAASAAPPSVPTPSNTVTQFDANGKNETPTVNVKAQVVETEMSEKQQRVSRMQKNATF